MRPTKRKLAPWTTAFPEQYKALRPENTMGGGVRFRSVPESLRMLVYLPIAEAFKKLYPRCQVCEKRGAMIIFRTDDVHHSHGRDGMLLFYMPWFVAVCRDCHNFIGSHPNEARALGVLCQEGEWNKDP